jgi:RNA polymerase sigma-70 factor (ECF subfamily)
MAATGNFLTQKANRRHQGHVYTFEMSDTEQTIIRKAAAGDRTAFRQLVLEHSNAMFRLAWRLSCDESAAEDIVQEAFVKAWRKIGNFRMQSSFRSWLHRITVNTAMDHLRKKSRRDQYETQEQVIETLPAQADVTHPGTPIDIRRQTQAAMTQLSEMERAALLLRHFEGHSIQEISQILEMTNSACKQTIFRAVRKMRIALRPLVTT